MLSRVRPLNQRGSSILPVLMIAMLLGAVVASFATLLDSLAQSRGRTDLRAEMDGVARAVKHALMQPDRCSQAFLAGGAPVTFDPLEPYVAGAPFGTNVEQVRAGGGGGPVVAQAGNVYLGANDTASRFQLVDIRLRPYKPSEVGPLSGLPTKTTGDQIVFENPVTGVALPAPWTTSPARLALRFTSNVTTAAGPTAMAGKGADTERLIDLIVARDAGGVVQACYVPSTAQAMDYSCKLATLTPTGPGGLTQPCPVPPPPPSNCKEVYYIQGFDGFGQPICQCALSCRYL